MQYVYLQINKLEGDIQISFSCHLLYMMTQYAYLRNNKLKDEIQILISCNLLYMTTQYVYLRNNKLKEDTIWHLERQPLLQGAFMGPFHQLTCVRIA